MTVHLLGIRHHGPGSARSVVRALDELGPDILLVEAPADVESSLGWVGRPGLIPPVALLGYVATEPGRAIFAPFASFSPEWQAIAWANRHNRPVAAIDLPMAVTFAAQGTDELVADSAPPDPLRELAAAAGDGDPERWWEDVIEHRGDGAPAFDAVAEAMIAARAGVDRLGPRGTSRGSHASCDQAGDQGRPREHRRGVRCLARARARPRRANGGGRQLDAARPAPGQGCLGLGAVDPPAPDHVVGLRRRRRQPGVVPARVRTPG